MASDATIALAWAARAVPLTPRAVVAIGAPARALGRRLAALADAELAALTAVAGPAALVVLGDAAALSRPSFERMAAGVRTAVATESQPACSAARATVSGLAASARVSKVPVRLIAITRR